MVPGFSNNTSSQFPMLNELQNQISEFLKCDCQDAFFDLLCPELNHDGIVFFFRTAMPKIIAHIEAYFTPAEAALKKVLCQDSITGPITNVLKKSYQSNYKNIYKQCFSDKQISDIMKSVQHSLKLGDEAESVN